MATSKSNHAAIHLFGAGGILAGLATALLPLTQSLPQTLTTGEVKTSVHAGIAIVIASLVTWAAGHFGLSAVEAKTVGTAVAAKAPEILDAVEQLPAVKSTVAKVEKKADDVAASLDARLTKLETADPAVKSVVTDVEATLTDAEKAALPAFKAILERLAGTTSAPADTAAPTPAA